MRESASGAELTVDAELAGRRVLVAGAEFLIANAIERALGERGCIVLGPAPSVAAALAWVAAGPLDAAVLEARLGGRSAAPVARALRARGIPFVVVTGYPGLPEPALREAPRIQKPLRVEELVQAVARAIGARQG